MFVFWEKFGAESLLAGEKGAQVDNLRSQIRPLACRFEWRLYASQQHERSFLANGTSNRVQDRVGAGSGR